PPITIPDSFRGSFRCAQESAPTHPGRHAPGLDLVRHTAALATDRPWFAIGGIDLGNLDEVVDAGARRVVVVRAITEADDPGAAAAEFTERLRAL
ncbi:thiamine phosphate synthase, partial [Streptomyces caniscabiei]|uniref:thiamine phosphate synthase n=1 Tax=Streptomyces caniscabiei TaxID=2746961 RepID=UPI0029A39EFE